MKKAVRLVAEYYDMDTNEVLTSEILRNDEVKKPTIINDLGYLHEQQIALLQSIQDFKLRHETRLLNQHEKCPTCGKKTKLNGKKLSKFHAVFTDHEVTIQKRLCRCGWHSGSTVESMYGSSLHPDLIEKQVIQGAENSYRQASQYLNADSKKNRCINNDDRIRRNVALVAQIIEGKKLKCCKIVERQEAAKQLVVVIDGGHIKSTDKQHRPFEAMIASIYRPEHVHYIDKHHTEITQKTSVASARQDQQETIQRLLLHACFKEGSHYDITELTCLTDGASNCWPISHVLKRCCKRLIEVLDWFHITKRFTTINNRVDIDVKEKLEKVKFYLWHGNTKKALERLKK